ncbi:Sau3AI family type II restriction endonuclease [Levilactobacillus tongjiangensis]|uniref:Sau3AI family type II restriction endonuclease n=1 Tax=Levilactobacillus tongjiangensis TaxID=2486023 RepID=A0ABW1SP64_9LACO|nr:Sau3AI family type II restriction endonuclease [Levilactobacillus tongjiangensis]
MKKQYKTKEEVHNRALDIRGKRFGDIADGISLKSKSLAGDVFEHWFGKEKDSASERDLKEADVELKATPFKQLKSKNKTGGAKYSAKERLVLNIINYENLANEKFETSHFLEKNSVIELGFYEYKSGISKSEWNFKDTVLFEIQKNSDDFAVIKNDWHTIQKYVLEGHAELLSESATDYLAACTKGKKGTNERVQPYSDVPAKQRAFSLKRSFMTNLLRQNILGDKKTESIFKGKFEIKKGSIENQVGEMLKPWIGWSVKKLEKKFDVKSTAKSKHAVLAARMLGLSLKVRFDTNSVKVAEFEKAGIVPKTVRFDEKGRNKESMSFAPFRFKNLAQQSWDETRDSEMADWHKFLLDSKFLFIVFQMVDGAELFQGFRFFNVPYSDLNGDIREVWEDTVSKIKHGVTLEAVKSSTANSGYVVNNNFVKLGQKASQRKICHVRPHAQKSDYSVNGKSSDELPSAIIWKNRPNNTKLFSDNWMTTQSFWFNHDYVRKQVLDLIEQ